MVTSNKMPDKKVVKMAEHSNIAVIPQRTLLGEVNEHITCPLCRGYYIDATTIVECLHSFCRSCIIKHLQAKSYCPQCEMMINSAKPNIKPDKALQDIVYKLVPGLFQREMERRQQFYASRPGPAASATPEQRGEDTERIIFSPEDVISFSLEYADVADTDSISSKSSDSNEPQPQSTLSRRYLQCPAVVNISQLKKFLSMKFDIDSSQFAIDILYKRVSLQDYYTLMDIAYIYNWKRNEPMRFFYQITDYVAFRSRLFDNRKDTSSKERKCSPSLTEDTNSPAPHINDQGSEISSRANSPSPDDNNTQTSTNMTSKNNDKLQHKETTSLNKGSATDLIHKKSDDEVEKSQFLNSFELTAKNNTNNKTSPTKVTNETNTPNTDITKNETTNSSTIDVESHKRKIFSSTNVPEMKKLKIELEKAKIPLAQNSAASGATTSHHQSTKLPATTAPPTKSNEVENKSLKGMLSSPTLPSVKENTHQQIISKPQGQDSSGTKRPISGQHNTSPPKRKSFLDNSNAIPLTTQKTVSPLKIQVPKTDLQLQSLKLTDTPKPPQKKLPDLKPSNPSNQSTQHKPFNKVRMDLLANNSDPTIDRSKILSQVKTSLSTSTSGQSSSGDPLKSLFDSCKINIPSSLSITLTDQKLESRTPEQINTEQNKNILNKNLTSASNVVTHKVPSPPVHNYIEILKLPDTDNKKQQSKPENNSDIKATIPSKGDNVTVQAKPTNKSSETSAKGPVPNLKPISDSKLAKQPANTATPITFQQTFEKQVQSMQTDKKPKVPKIKTQVPKLVPASPKTLNVAAKVNSPNNCKPNTASDTRPGNVLDLSTPHNVQSQLGPQQSKAFETMQSIANLAKKQSLPAKGVSSPAMVQSTTAFNTMSNRPLNTSLRIPTTNTINQIKLEKIGSSVTQSITRQDVPKSNQGKQSNNLGTALAPLFSSPNSSNTTQASPRPQTRSPSSSPKLVIAEDKQTTGNDSNQSNQISSTQISNTIAPKSESPKASPGPSKTSLKPLKPIPTTSKLTSIQQPIVPNNTMNTPTDYLSPPHLQALLRQQIEIRNAWIKATQLDLYKNMSKIPHQPSGDFNKEK